MNESIVIVEDDERLAEVMKDKLVRYGFEVSTHPGTDDLLQVIQQTHPAVVLLDINLPTFDGFYWCRQIRKVSNCPVIFISVRDRDLDQVMALEHGGDDYITKPFATDVLVAKVRSHIRRAYGAYATTEMETEARVKGLTLFPKRLELHFGQELVFLSQKEGLLLELLINRYPEVVKREAILAKLWDERAFIDENTLNVNISRARKQLKTIGAPHVIETVRGVGYRLSMGEQRIWTAD